MDCHVSCCLVGVCPVLSCFWTEYVGNAMLGGFSGFTVAMWLAIRVWPCIIFALVLYLCTSGMFHDFPLYGCVSGERAYVLSEMTWVFSEFVSVVRDLGLCLLDLYLSPSDVLQVPDALSLRVVALSAVVVVVFPPSEVSQGGVLVLGAHPC